MDSMSHLFDCPIFSAALRFAFDLPDDTTLEAAWGLKPFKVTYLASAFMAYHKVRHLRKVAEPEDLVLILAASLRAANVRARARST